MNHDNKLSFAEKLGYGMGDAACGIVYSSVTMFLTWFYTDIYGLSAAAVGVMFLVTRVLDAITDPLTGIVADRVKTRWGHFRPWLIWFAVPYAVLAVMTFTTPEFGASGKLVYAYLTYTLLMLCYTFINIPYCALGGVITRDEKDRLSAQSYRFTISSLAGLMVSVATLFLVDFFGKENKQYGFQATMGIMGAIAIVMLAFCFFSTKERVAPAVEQQGSIREDLRQLLANDQWRIVAIITFFSSMAGVMRSAATLYYATYLSKVLVRIQHPGIAGTGLCLNNGIVQLRGAAKAHIQPGTGLPVLLAVVGSTADDGIKPKVDACGTDGILVDLCHKVVDQFIIQAVGALQDGLRMVKKAL